MKIFITALLVLFTVLVVFWVGNKFIGGSYVGEIGVVDRALISEDIGVCNKARAFVHNNGDYMDNFDKKTAIDICRGMYYGIRGELSLCGKLETDSGSAYCTYYYRWYPKTKDSCMREVWVDPSKDTFCEGRLRKCPLTENSEYCRRNKLE